MTVYTQTRILVGHTLTIRTRNYDATTGKPSVRSIQLIRILLTVRKNRQMVTLVFTVTHPNSQACDTERIGLSNSVSLGTD